MAEMSNPFDEADTEVRSGPAPEPRPQEVVETLVTTAHAMRRFGEARLGHYKAAFKLSPSRARVLRVVAFQGSLRMSDLAERLGLAARTVTDLVDGMERDGMLVRRPDTTDRRATLVELTPSMQDQFEHLYGMFGELSKEVLAPLDVAERRQLMDLLTRLRSGPIGEFATDIPWDDVDDCPE